MKKPENKVALITGGLRGIGLAMVQALLEQGMAVAAVGRRESGIAPLLRACEGRTENLLAIASDLTEAGVVDQVVARVIERFGRIDILVNNAGVGNAIVRKDYLKNPAPFWQVTPQQWREMLSINTDVQFYLSRAVVGGMMDRRWGRIVNVTTSLYSMIREGRLPYGPSKAAMEATAAVMAADLAGTGVTVNVLVPGGPTDTDMLPLDSGMDRSKMIPPSVMGPPLKWIVSADADDFTAKRIVAAKWIKNRESGIAPIAWLGLGNEVISPPTSPT